MGKQRLLVIEDNIGIADLVNRIATDAGFEARTVSKGKEIIAAYDEFQPHVIVLDILMPDMDGIEVLDFLFKRKSAARVIILSGDADFRPIAERIAGGFNIEIVANLAKPFRARELISVLETVRFSGAAAEEPPKAQIAV